MSTATSKTKTSPSQEKKRPGPKSNDRPRGRADDAAALRQTAEKMFDKGDAEGALDVLMGIIDSLRRDNERLTYRLQMATIARYGRRSEKLSKEELRQLVLAFGGTKEQATVDEPEVPTPAPPANTEDKNDNSETGGSRSGKRPKKKRPNHHGRGQLDPSLPRIVQVVHVPEQERACQHCHAQMEPIGHVDHERVEFVPAKIEVHIERREKLACKACRQDITTAARASDTQAGPRIGASLLAHLIESKCDDALPVYRQHDQLSRLGFHIPLNTLYDNWDYATSLLMPIAQVTVSAILAQYYVGVDDTKLDYLDPGAPKGKRRGHLWCFVGAGPLVGFTFTETWKAEDIEPWLLTIDGFIQCDDYKGYSVTTGEEGGEKRILVPPDRRLGCMMHVRRRFHRAYKGGYLQAAVPLKLIADIYAVEAKAKQAAMTADARLELRRAESVPILERFNAWVDTHEPDLPPMSPLATAAGYAKNQRPFIQRCFTDGRFEIDNGEPERQIREPAVGRKNFLFTGSVQAAHRLAAAYTLVLSGRRLGIPVPIYLADVITKVANGWPARRINELRPDLWAEARGLLPSPYQAAK